MPTSLRNPFIAFATIGYLLFSLAWIWLTDQLLVAFADVASMVWLSTAKGLFFVVASAAFFFMAMRAVPTDRQSGAPPSLDTLLIAAMPEQPRPHALVFVVAASLSLLSLALREGMGGQVADQPMLMLFMFPIIFSALLGGVWPGLLSTALVSAGVLWLAIAPVGSLFIDRTHDAIQWGFLIVNGVVVSVLSEVLRRAVRRAQTSQRLLDQVVQGTSDAVFVKDTQGRYVLANQAAARFLGQTQDTILGQTDETLFGAETARTLRARDQVAMAIQAIQQTETHEERLRTADGQMRVFVVTKGPVRDEVGRVAGLFGVAHDITERERSAALLQQSEERLKMAIEATTDGLWDWNLETGEVYRSPRYYEVIGYAASDDTRDFGFFSRILHPDDRGRVLEIIQSHVRGETAGIDFECRVIARDGTVRWMKVRGQVSVHAADGRALRVVGTNTDITERKQFELVSSEAAAVLHSLHEGVMVVSLDGTIQRVNPAFERITGYSASEVVGRSPKVLASGQHGPAFYAEMWRSIHEQGHWHGEIWNRRKSGELYPELISISAVRDAAGQVQHYVGVSTDIGQLKAHESALHQVANYDILTGLPNRRLLGDRLDQALARSQRTGRTLAVAYIDLDSFKAVNDAHGHAVGDQLLVQMAERLKGVLRGDDTLARLGGDEFVLLFSDLDSPDACHALARQALAAIATPVLVDGAEIHTTASLGLTLFPQDAADADTLLRHADQAMYLAKEAGKNSHVVFDPIHDRQVQAHREQLQRLRQAYAGGEFVLFYQPKVNLLDGTVIGAEALIRWQHPERGLVSPAEFMPMLEGSDLEPLVGNWVIRSALAQMQAWHEQGLDMRLSVNVSATHLLHPDFQNGLRLMLQDQPAISPDHLELEILETAGLADMDRAVQVLTQCQALGVSFSLDDFGTGYSSLAYFRRLPVHMIKIDQSFVRNMLADDNDFGIVDSVVRLAHAFNRPVIAEGVETLAHGARLLQLGCHLAQGYGIARPMPATELPDWVQQWAHDAPWKAL